METRDSSPVPFDPADSSVAMVASDTLKHRRVLVGVSGGIACYKSCTLVSRLAQMGAEVTVMMSPSAMRFVQPLTFAALSGKPVLTSQWEQVDALEAQHIRTARQAEVCIVAPATMDLCAKLAIGLCDDVLTSVLAAIDRNTTPVLLAPSMNAVMWAQPSNQRNMSTLRADGFLVLDPASGWQACREVGPGRMPEPDALAEIVRGALARSAS